MVSHLEQDRLVLLALGEEALDVSETGHLDTCEACRSEVADLRTVAGLGRQTQEVHDLPAPPEHVWHLINAELGTSEREAPVPVAARRPRRRPVLMAAAAAAIAALVAAAVTYVLVKPAASACTQRVTLSALPGAPAGANGEACLVRSEGEEKLRITAKGMPAPTDGFYEVWLIDGNSLRDPAHLRMATLGNMAGAKSEDFTLPPNVDVTRYDVVDVSAEPNDGNAAHSGKSLLRGRL
jgi:hypothetical protein